MTFTFAPLLAEGTTRTILDWGRIDSNADLVLPLLVLVALDVLVRYLIRLDTRELPRLVGWVLTALRIATIFCLWVVYLQPEWRSEREVVRNSRALLLVDTSLSMGLSDAGSASASGGSTRLEQVTAALDETDLLKRLRKTHDVVVLRFDENLHRVVSLEKVESRESSIINHQSSIIIRHPPNSQLPTPSSPEDRIDWNKALAPTGTQTRLGQALAELIRDQRGVPVSGIVVFSDGGQNAGLPPEAAIEEAQAAKVPIFTVGVGREQRAANVRVCQLEVPPQAHPGDPYSVTGLIQAQGLTGKSVGIELLLREAGEGTDAATPGSGTPVRREEVILGGDGEAVPVKFELTPTEIGRRTICLRVQAPEGDSDSSDDYQEEEIEIVDRKIRVLLFAGGPAREYRFLRTLLYRDVSTTVDILLQTAEPGVSQEADRILDDFPATAEEMYAYDCLVALDPDWRVLTRGQVELLEGWVAERGGGLIVIPGPIHAGESISGWLQNPDLGKIRALYPVEFQRQLTVFEGGTYVSSEPWPLDFTREGLEAEFLWLDDTATASQQAWAEFGGVSSCFPVRGAKPGAIVLARFSDPRADQGDQEPIYFAEQFYGSGRVFYSAGGEMWRLRRADEAYFERFYTSLIRHVSQGRLLEQSSRGALLVDRDRYVLGDTVEIHARLANAQLEPLEAPAVALEVVGPDGSLQAVTLRPDPGRPGMFAGQLTVLREGTYRLELPVPDSRDQRLIRRLKVKLPDLERQTRERNDKLLSRIAQGTNGKYYPRLEEALSADVPDSVVGRLKDRTKTIIQTGTLDPPTLRWLFESRLPDQLRQQAWFSWLADETWLRKLLDQTLVWWLMIVVCSLLCCEWLIRRLSKLA